MTILFVPSHDQVKAATKGRSSLVYARVAAQLTVPPEHALHPELSFVDTFESICSGANTYGPFWDHILGYWRASESWPENVLFLRYEELLRDPAENVRKLARFVELPFSKAEEEACRRRARHRGPLQSREPEEPGGEQDGLHGRPQVPA
ncbi:Flavonol sulfotransferase-like protein [Hordeum vulgare]|nr:Flavonol sulfotransferase-like protein [Hordeum vulgare]